MKEKKLLPKFGHAKKTEEDKMIVLPEEESKELKEAIKRLSNAFKWKTVVLRGLVNGVFTALGATVGIAVLFYILIGLYAGLRDVPLINQFMEATGLDQVVEYVIDQRENNADIGISNEDIPQTDTQDIE